MKHLELKALMSATVVEVAVHAGQPVVPGALLLVLEAMTMEHELRAEHAWLLRGVAFSRVMDHEQAGPGPIDTW